MPTRLATVLHPRVPLTAYFPQVLSVDLRWAIATSQKRVMEGLLALLIQYVAKGHRADLLLEVVMWRNSVTGAVECAR